MPYCITVSSYLALFIHSSQLLHRRLSLIADSVSIGCSVGWVELYVVENSDLPSNQRANLFWLHSLSLKGFSLFDNSFSDPRLCENPHISKT